MPASILKEPREQKENILFTFKDEHLTEVLGLTKVTISQIAIFKLTVQVGNG